MIQRRMFGLFTLMLFAMLISGCGSGVSRPQVGLVSGKVLLDGDPVPNITVVMKPDVGRAAIGVTNDKGEYQVEYTLGEKGTKIGSNTVSLEWPLGFAAPFTIPAKYAMSKSELKLDVKKGSQTFDIDIELPNDKGGAKKPPIVVD